MGTSLERSWAAKGSPITSQSTMAGLGARSGSRTSGGPAPQHRRRPLAGEQDHAGDHLDGDHAEQDRPAHPILLHEQWAVP